MSVDEVERELARALNRVSAEGGSNTPDFVLGRLLASVLAAVDEAVNRRDAWYGVELAPGQPRPRLMSDLRATELVYEALGQVVACWSGPGGVSFDAARAADVARALLRVFGFREPAGWGGEQRLLELVSEGGGG